MRGASTSEVGSLLDGLFQERQADTSLFSKETLPEVQSPRQSSYQLASGSINVTEMLQRATLGLEGRAESFFDRTLRSRVWSEEPGVLSLRSFDNPQENFEKITGAMRIKVAPSEIRQPALREFFQDESRVFVRGGAYETRGPAYYVARNSALDPIAKLESMERDMRAVFKILGSVERSELNHAEFVYYLGALDHLKVHSISLYQVLTHSERKGQLNSDAEYAFNKSLSLELSKSSVRAFFQHALGQGVGYRHELDWFSTLANQVFDYTRSAEFSSKLGDSGRFKLQECDHPVVIGLNAHENALKFPDTDVIVALPLGGLQPGLATQFAFSLVHNREPNLITAPLSMHSGKEVSSGGISNEVLTQLLLQANVAGKSVLVTEDNSNTGSTVNAITKALYAAGAREVHVALAELDVVRVRLKQGTVPPSPFMADLEHPDFVTAVRQVPMRENSKEEGKIGAQMIKLYADRVLSRGPIEVPFH